MIRIRWILFTFLLLSIASKGQDFWEEVILPDSVVPVKLDFDTQGNLFLLTLNNIYKSSDNGLTWLDLNLIQEDSYNKDIEISNNNVLFFGVDPFGNFFVSDNYGQSWDTIQTQIQGMIVLRMINNEAELLAGTWGGIYKSLDFGINWTKVLDISSVEVINDIISNGEYLYAGSVNWMNSDNGGVYRSSDFGNTWELIGLYGYGIYSFAVDSSNNLCAGVFLAPLTSSPGIYRTYDEGGNWINIYSEAYIGSVISDPFGGIFGGATATIGNQEWGIIYSPDNGLNWSELNTGMEYCEGINYLTLSPDLYLYAITYSPSKLYRSSNVLVRQIELSPFAKMEVTIYPNPFKDRICIDINQAFNEVEIALFSSQMQKVYSYKLKNTEKNNPFCIEVNGLSQGLFLIQLIADNLTLNYKIIKN